MQDVALDVLTYSHMRRIAGQALTRFRGNPFTIPQLGAAFKRLVGQNVRVDVNHDLIWLAPLHFAQTLAQSGFG